MRVSYDWLRDYVDIDLQAAELADLLTLSGSEVESVGPVSTELHEQIIVAQITHLQPHPEGKLSVATVDIGGDSSTMVRPMWRWGKRCPWHWRELCYPVGRLLLRQISKG